MPPGIGVAADDVASSTGVACGTVIASAGEGPGDAPGGRAYSVAHGDEPLELTT